MCGLCGFVDFTQKSDLNQLDRMVSTLQHRGPDDHGSEIFPNKFATIGFGHTRLSILDLSPAGHQPMHYKHLCILLNGEIYNFREIRNELISKGHQFESDSDTEVVIHSVEEWGLPSISKFIGMFVFVIFNKKTQEIIIIRDRAGVKPLYYYWDSSLFLFSSELKAFHQHSGFKKEINLNAVKQFMNFGYIPSPNCIFTNCNKLNPGHSLTFSIEEKKTEIKKYWEVDEFYQFPKLKINFQEAKHELQSILKSAFEYRMVSDVPVGIFLSGGYDSTAVASFLQSGRTEKLKTFTIGFREGNNEAPFAKSIASFLGTDHTEYICTTKEAQELIPSLPFYFDEPFADSSAIPTILVSKLAKKDVTVALSADAGDEIFGGYIVYDAFINNIKQLKKVPNFLRNGVISDIVKKGGFLLLDRNSQLEKKVEVVSKFLAHSKVNLHEVLYQSYFSLSDSFHEKLFLNSINESENIFSRDYTKFYDLVSGAMAIDYKMYLPDDIMTKVDRSTMSVSLEGREPFLDHRIIEFAAQLPTEFKIKNSKKIILKDLIHDQVPKSMMDRPKTGFSIPLTTWLKSDLQYLFSEYLNPVALNNSNVFNPTFVDKLSQDLIKGRNNDSTVLWKIIQFQMWYAQWM